MGGVEKHWEGLYDGDNPGCIEYLTRCLEAEGPFVGWFKAYTTHNPLQIFREEGEVLRGDEHAVLISGFGIWRSRSTGEMGGFWTFSNSYGLDWGRSGFGSIAFNALRGVEVPLLED